MILAAFEAERFPFFTCWVARAFALAAWARSGIGYFLNSGSPNFDGGSAFRCFVFIFAPHFPVLPFGFLAVIRDSPVLDCAIRAAFPLSIPSEAQDKYGLTALMHAR